MSDKSSTTDAMALLAGQANNSREAIIERVTDSMGALVEQGNAAHAAAEKRGHPGGVVILDETEPRTGGHMDIETVGLDSTHAEPSDAVIVGGWHDVLAQTDSARRDGLKSTREAARATSRALVNLGREGRRASKSMRGLAAVIREGAPLAVKADSSALGASLYYSIRQRRGMSVESQRGIIETARAKGHTWAEIAEPLEMNPDTLRKRMAQK
jgi:hypothetical protein